MAANHAPPLVPSHGQRRLAPAPTVPKALHASWWQAHAIQLRLLALLFHVDARHVGNRPAGAITKAMYTTSGGRDGTLGI